MLVQVQDSNGSSAAEDLNFQPTLRSYGNANYIQPIRVRVPASVAGRAWKAGRNKRETVETNRRAGFIFYKNDSFFEARVETSYVISIDVGVDTVLRDLDESVSIEHLGVTQHGQVPVDGNEFRMLRTTLSCKYWEYSTSSWKSDGCCLNSSSNPPQCLCNHLTNFALLVRSEQVPSDVALSIVSDVGLAISIVGMIITAIVIASTRNLRKPRTGKILIHICINLSIAHLLFVIAVSRVKHHVTCMVVAALIQYFFLTSWCWMSVYSYDMYISLVKVFSKYRSQFLQKGTLFCYGIPAVIVGITVAVSVGYFDRNQDPVFCDGTSLFRRSSYLADNLCWIRGYSLYLGFLAPIAVFLLYNCVVFVVVTVTLDKHNKEVQSIALRRTTRQSLLVASTMVVVLGITWIFAYLMLISDDQVYLTITSWLFAIFCSLQGLGIFLLTTVRRAECINCGTGPSSTRRSGNSKSTGTSKAQPSSNNADQEVVLALMMTSRK
uniref:Probable G-protein coupled receptor 128 n=1 Tax=Phallusia mammillata TaxID=59560 RepID=A0A6F9DEM0_9ASCI|nr:probable G-protein coupled receptor 128 [Phallusia mammillata]